VAAINLKRLFQFTAAPEPAAAHGFNSSCLGM